MKTKARFLTCILTALLAQPLVGRSDDVKVVSDNMVEGGDAELGKVVIGSSGTDATLFEGNPVNDGKPHEGEFCFLIQNKPDAIGAGVLKIDPAKTYRVKLQAYTTDGDLQATIGGYAFEEGKSTPLLGEDGTTWQYDVKDKFGGKLQGPLEAWTSYEATIGPAGSDAGFTWPANASAVGLTFWIYGSPGSEPGPTDLYLDNIVIEEIQTKTP